MINIAVYGTLREGQGNHPCLMGSPLLGMCRLEGYEMVSLGGFPAIEKTGKGSVLVEVYQCGEQAEARCNRLEGYDPDAPTHSFYDRDDIKTPFGAAVVYTMPGVLTERSHDKIEDGDWCNYVGSARTLYV